MLLISFSALAVRIVFLVSIISGGICSENSERSGEGDFDVILESKGMPNKFDAMFL